VFLLQKATFTINQLLTSHRYTNCSEKNHDMLQGKLTITILISTTDYTLQHIVHQKETQRRLAGSTFLLEFCISRMKKENLLNLFFFVSLITFVNLCGWIC